MRSELTVLLLLLVLCLVSTGMMLLVPPGVLEAGLIYQGF